MLMLWQPFSGQIPCFDFTMGTTLFFSPCPWWNVLDPETNPSWTLQFYIQDTVDGSEIPFTTAWDEKNLANNLDKLPPSGG